MYFSNGRPMNTSPKDGTIVLAWCVHSADPLQLDNGKLTIYGGHVYNRSVVDDGFNLVQWGGAWDDSSWEDQNAGNIPDWWFQANSEFEVVANPVCWFPLPSGEPIMVNKD